MSFWKFLSNKSSRNIGFHAKLSRNFFFPQQRIQVFICKSPDILKLTNQIFFQFFDKGKIAIFQSFTQLRQQDWHLDERRNRVFRSVYLYFRPINFFSFKFWRKNNTHGSREFKILEFTAVFAIWMQALPHKIMS